MNEEGFYHICNKCKKEPVATVSITVWRGTNNVGGRVLELCGECFDKLAEAYNLRDENGNYGKNCTLQNEAYEKYLLNKW